MSGDGDELVAALRRSGLRATPARLLVAGIVAESGEAMSSAEIMAQLPRDMDRTTVFRCLASMTRARLLRRIGLGDLARFELARGNHASQHPHFVCTVCGATECMLDATVVVGRTGEVPAALASRDVEIEVRGRCALCT
ncbi:MAG TPA: transcriptional repressor [Kofleriaceae bacterium]